MGGTTAKASIIAEGRYSMTPETEVGGEITLGQRMTQGSGYIVQAPTIDIGEVGAGGGSIAWLDSGGGIQVGPNSAGAKPGPICYDQGGTKPTVTDANLHLGYLNPNALVGGELTLNQEKSESSLAKLAKKLKQEQTNIAYGIHLIANARMMRALSAVSSERGLDPSKFPLMAFGGNGGVHVCNLAETLGCTEVLVPPAAGLFSALGLLFADTEHQCIRAFYQSLEKLDVENCNAVLSSLYQEADSLLATDGYEMNKRQVNCFADMRYIGQNTALTLPIPNPPIDNLKLGEIKDTFANTHETTFGYRSESEDIQFVSLKATGQGQSAISRVPNQITQCSGDVTNTRSRNAYYGDLHRWIETPIVTREDLKGEAQKGPLIIEEYDSTTVVRPDWAASIDSWNNIVLSTTDG